MLREDACKAPPAAPIDAPFGYWRMRERHRHSSLADTFRDELNLSVQCTRHADLAEGVRALLIDKDKTPRWSYPDVASVPSSAIDDFLAPLWSPAEHPLRDL